MTLPRVGHPCGWRQPLESTLQLTPFVGAALQAAAALAGWRQSIVPAGGASAQSHRPLLPLAGTAGLPFGLALAAANRPLAGGLGRSLAVGGRPSMGACRGWPPLLLASFAMKIQQKHVERFYAIQSHHTQFKTNLSHENLGSDTIVRKPHWRERGEYKVVAKVTAYQP
ncbi:hypothetical protein BHE74_00013092 [Ensete ventricosum]|nr:hypothetical protein GW17_00036348 [Ensete ventricosum]RWW78679.1 hypothetical protein BHE74_00013092 [Ensete ventricosum]RZR88955.1 hypothetical protein BHM03_00016615 [Ensete ventricosum]